MPKSDGYFQPGNSGKPQGAINHLTKTVKETVLAVFNDIQSDPKVNLNAFAKKYPRDFYQIAARLIPTEIHARVSQINLHVVRNGHIPEVKDTPSGAAASLNGSETV
jgi:hypothetical protein